MKIVIINYGAGNIQSIMFAIERLGFKAVLSNNPDEINSRQSDFPGVGEASSAMKMLESGLDSLIPLKQPVWDLFRNAVDVQCFGRRGYKRLGDRCN
jgi:glutamine amidotransferase